MITANEAKLLLSKIKDKIEELRNEWLLISKKCSHVNSDGTSELVLKKEPEFDGYYWRCSVCDNTKPFEDKK